MNSTTNKGLIALCAGMFIVMCVAMSIAWRERQRADHWRQHVEEAASGLDGAAQESAAIRDDLQRLRQRVEALKLELPNEQAPQR